MLIDFAITNYKSIKDTVHLNMVFNTEETDEQLDKTYNYDNYRNFFKVFTSDNGRVNVCPLMALFGANASGKSNILKAFLALRGIILNGFVENFYIPFKFSSKTENAPTKFELTFSTDDENNPCIYTYSIAYTNHRIVREYLKEIGKIKDKIIFDTFDFDTVPVDMWQVFITRRRPIASIFSDAQYNSDTLKDKMKKGLNALKNFFDKLFIADDINLAQISMYNKNTVKDWLLRMDMKFCDIKLEEIEPTLDRNQENTFLLKKVTSINGVPVANIKEIKHEKERLEKRFPNHLVLFEFDESNTPLFRVYSINMEYKKDAKEKLVCLNYIKDESTGTKNLFRFLFVLVDALQNGKIIVFDEIDRTIHTELLKFLFGVIQAQNLNKYGAQMICSSHNPYVIQTAGHQGTMLIERKSDLSTKVNFLSEYTCNTDTVLDDYLNGRFGGTPQVIDVFETMEVPNAPK